MIKPLVSTAMIDKFVEQYLKEHPRRILFLGCSSIIELTFMSLVSVTDVSSTDDN